MKIIERVGTVMHKVNAVKCDAPDPSLYVVDESKYNQGGFKPGLNRKDRRKLLKMKSFNFTRKHLRGKMDSLTQKVMEEGYKRTLLSELDKNAAE